MSKGRMKVYQTMVGGDFLVQEAPSAYQSPPPHPRRAPTKLSYSSNHAVVGPLAGPCSGGCTLPSILSSSAPAPQQEQTFHTTFQVTCRFSGGT